MLHTATRAVEHWIGNLDDDLREALLLTTRYTYAKSADILGISKAALRDRVREAKRQITAGVLGDEEWHDPETCSVVAMHIDAAAIRMNQASVANRTLADVT